MGRGLLHRAHHLGVGVADDHRAPGADVVDIALAIGIPHISPFGARDEARRATHRAEGTHGGVHAAGNGLLGAVEELLVTGHGVEWNQGLLGTWRRGRRLADMQAIPCNFTAIDCQSGANMREHGGTGTILAVAGWRGRHGFGTICAGF
ncbi:hypothetical protein D3C81_1618010 [compost metagenome]